MAELSPEVRNRVLETVLGDIEPSRLRIYTKTGLAVAVGGVLSLFLCSQFGVGMTPLAEMTHHGVLRHLGSLACALICGVAFATLPVVVLRLLCRAVEFRAVLRKGRVAPMVWILGLGGALAYHGDHGKELIELTAWALAATITFRGLAQVFDKVHAGPTRLAT